MFVWEQGNRARRASTLAASFTPEEFARLVVLRERYETSRDCEEYGLDVRRLCFVQKSWRCMTSGIHEPLPRTPPS